MRRGLVTVRNDVYLNYSHTVSGFANLYILRAVQETVESLCLMQKNFEMLIGVASTGIKEIAKARQSGSTTPLDPEGKAVAGLEENERILKELYADLARKRQSAKDDPELTGDHEDSVVQEFDRAIKCSETLYRVTRDLRWEIMEHDSDLEKPSGKVFRNPKDLISSILN